MFNGSVLSLLEEASKCMLSNWRERWNTIIIIFRPYTPYLLSPCVGWSIPVNPLLNCDLQPSSNNFIHSKAWIPEYCGAWRFATGRELGQRHIIENYWTDCFYPWQIY